MTTQVQSSNRLDRLAAIFMIAASLVLIYSALGLRGSKPQPAEIYKPGEFFAELPGVDFSGSPKTLVLFLRSDCRFCIASAPFYKTILDLPHRMPVVAVSFEQEEQFKRYLADHGLRPDHVVSARRGTLKLSATPVILLVDHQRKIERLWYGRLKPDRETEVRNLTMSQP